MPHSRLLGMLLVVGCAACGEPGGPMRVQEREVRFTSDSITLVGTLVLPDTSTPVPAVVLVHGSGPETRDHYMRYARQFASNGIAALAYDKRGAGASSPGNPRAPFHVLANDVLAAVDFLRREPAIDGARVGLWGLSEGEWVVPLAASRMNDPAFLIIVSASGVSPSEQVRLEMRNALRAKGYPDSIVALAESLHRGIAAFQRDGRGRDSLNQALQKVAKDQWFADAEVLDARLPEYDRVLALDWFPGWRANMDFDARALLRQQDTPLLVVLGGTDANNDPALADSLYRELKRDAPKGTVDVLTFPDAGHALLEWWLPFRLPPPRYPEGYFRAQVEWMKRQLQRQAGFAPPS